MLKARYLTGSYERGTDRLRKMEESDEGILSHLIKLTGI